MNNLDRSVSAAAAFRLGSRTFRAMMVPVVMCRTLLKFPAETAYENTTCLVPMIRTKFFVSSSGVIPIPVSMNHSVKIEICESMVHTANYNSSVAVMVFECLNRDI